jgi:hypothetical protein
MLLEWVRHNPLITLLGYWVLSSLVGSLPPLPSTAGFFAQWAYMFMHLFAGNVRALAAIAQKAGLPGLPAPETTRKEKSE